MFMLVFRIYIDSSFSLLPAMLKQSIFGKHLDKFPIPLLVIPF
jgi:hypothetical protein